MVFIANVNVLIIVNFLVVDVKAGCSGGVSICNWTPWKSWSGCSQTCGGGTQRRNRPYCCKLSLVNDISACMSNCGHNMEYYYRYRSVTQPCNTRCYNNGYINSYNSCDCSDNVFGTCCEKQCKQIENCKRRRCTSSWDNKCLECYDDKIFFKKTNNDKKCERLCAWNNHYCWPGRCGNELTNQCTCAAGFKLIQQSGETSCQPEKQLSLPTCNTVVIGPNMEKKQAKSSSTSTECQYLQDIYGSFQLSSFKFDITAVYTIDLTSYTKPAFISEFNFGITDFATQVVKVFVDGRRSKGSQMHHFVDTKSSENCKRILHDSKNISVTSSLQDGQALVLQFHVDAGGYLKSKNRITHAISGAVPYQKVHSTREIFYRFDNAPPKHCLENGKCSYEPIQLASRVTRATKITVDFNGWYDPVPNNGKSIQSSSIESYQITVNEVYELSKFKLGVLYLTNVFTEKIDFKLKKITLNLFSGNPRLYSVTLEVKDVADNVRQARRFILYDNTSFIETGGENPFRITSASIQTNYKWQTHHHSICLNWKDHFLNRFYHDNPLLNPILPDPHGLVTGIYEQNSGILAVSGTPNVYGIVKTMVYWSLNGGSPSEEIQVPDFLNQSYCKDFKVKDGQTYTFYVRNIDIVGNTLIENRTVHIDKTIPHINYIWIVKEGYKTKVVNQKSDLTKMMLTFEAMDPHSGIKRIELTIGYNETDLSSVLTSVQSLVDDICPANVTKCYCPDVGLCELYNYTVPLNKFISNIKHVGNYSFDVKVINKAHLINIKRIELWINDSLSDLDLISKDMRLLSDENILKIMNTEVHPETIVGGVLSGTLVCIVIGILCGFYYRRYSVIFRLTIFLTVYKDPKLKQKKQSDDREQIQDSNGIHLSNSSETIQESFEMHRSSTSKEVIPVNGSMTQRTDDTTSDSKGDTYMELGMKDVKGDIHIYSKIQEKPTKEEKEHIYENLVI